ncbi:MAG: hypothetical protein J0L75_11910 [Spirochaetes bacterium]|nr:hypothetical protein [Spirochaetota bacterium]
MNRIPALTILAAAFLAGGCATTPDTINPSGTGPSIQTDTRPAALFSEKKIASITVMGFDGKGVQTYRGALVDYVDLARTFTDDLLRSFYEGGKIRVSLGEVVDTVQVADSVEKRVGDFNIKRSELATTVTYKASPYRKVDAVLSGRITRFSSENNYDKSYLEVYFKLTDPYDGTVYWISRMRGTWRNVIDTLTETLEAGAYTEIGTPAAVEATPAEGAPKPAATNAAPAPAKPAATKKK